MRSVVGCFPCDPSNFLRNIRQTHVRPIHFSQHHRSLFLLTSSDIFVYFFKRLNTDSSPVQPNQVFWFFDVIIFSYNTGMQLGRLNYTIRVKPTFFCRWHYPGVGQNLVLRLVDTIRLGQQYAFRAGTVRDCGC